MKHRENEEKKEKEIWPSVKDSDCKALTDEINFCDSLATGSNDLSW